MHADERFNIKNLFPSQRNFNCKLSSALNIDFLRQFIVFVLFVVVITLKHHTHQQSLPMSVWKVEKGFHFNRARYHWISNFIPLSMKRVCYTLSTWTNIPSIIIKSILIFSLLLSSSTLFFKIHFPVFIYFLFICVQHYWAAFESEILNLILRRGNKVFFPLFV